MSEPENRLFPLFLKLEHFRVLIVGGGAVGLEKLTTILHNSPATSVQIVSITFHENIVALAQQYPNVQLIQRAFRSIDLNNADILITALNNADVSAAICKEARARKIFVNAADKPELCDFYLGSIVQKGNLKIAISTNGKSPTMAKRLKEWLDVVLPKALDETLHHLQAIRSSMKGEVAAKIERLNELTKGFVGK